MSAVLQVPPPPKCDHCQDKLLVWNQWAGRDIRCPKCTVRPKRRRDAKEFGELISGITAREAVYQERERMRNVVFAIIDTFHFPGLPNELAPTDRILQRMAAFGSGVPSEDPDVYRESRPPPLDPVTQQSARDALATCAPGTIAVIGDWYFSKKSVKQICARRHLSRWQLSREWRANLSVVRFKFLASPDITLVRLARFVP